MDERIKAQYTRVSSNAKDLLESLSKETLETIYIALYTDYCNAVWNKNTVGEYMRYVDRLIWYRG